MASCTEAGYAYRFVNEPAELFKCEICRLVLREPQLTECCGKNACRLCILRKAENNQPCPISKCKESHVKINFNRELHFDILKSAVFCPSSEAGCGWVGRLESLNKHLEVCPNVEVECPNSCGLMIQRHMIKDHETVCERSLVNCHQCGDPHRRMDLSNHLKECLFTKVECPFTIVGCKSVVLNKDLQQHFEESLSDHYTLVSKQSQSVAADIRSSKLLFEIKDEVAPQLKDVAALTEEVAAAKDEVSKLLKGLEEAENEFTEVQKKHVDVANEIERLTLERDAILCSLRKDQDLSMFESKVRCYGPELPRLHPRDIVSRPVGCPVVTAEYVPRVSFAIQRFDIERKNDALIYLPPFFSRKGGYKMCLAVYCNGYMQARGNSLSVFVSVLKGKYDTYLDWPMKCKVVVEILNSTHSSYNCSQTVEVQLKSRVLADDDDVKADTTSNCCLRFINLPLLKPPSPYLANGCLWIDVARVF